MKETIKTALLCFYIRHIERYKDGKMPKGHLKLFVFDDDFEVFEREEDNRHFLLSKNGNDSGTYKEVVIIDEYPEFNIYDIPLETLETYCQASYKGKVEGEDRFVYFVPFSDITW